MSEATKKGFMSWYFQSNLLVRILIGLIGGAIAGILVASMMPDSIGSFVSYTRPFGDLFVRLLKMIVVPVIFFSLISGSASIAPSELGRVGLKILVFYLLTSAFSVFIGLAMAHIIQPGEGFVLAGSTGSQLSLKSSPPFSQVLLAIVPTNPIDSLAKGDILPIIFFAVSFGIGLSILQHSKDETVSRPANILNDVVNAAAQVMYKIVHAIMQYAPIGVFVLISNVFAMQGPQAIGSLLMVTFTTYAAFAVQIVVLYAGILLLFKLKPFYFFKYGSQPIITAFVTRSSSGTLPITLQTCEDEFGVPRSVSSFTLPLGATINMDGTAIYLGVCAMFIGFATGNPLTFDQQFLIILTATLGSIGAAGVPGAGAIMLIMVMETIGMPIVPGTDVAAMYAVVLGIDALFDMGRTALNVTGDMIGSIVVSKMEGQLDESKWEQHS